MGHDNVVDFACIFMMSILSFILVGPNQIKTFLEEHGCEGIQHIGLYTPDICNAVTFMRSSGLSFMTPPAEYYFEVGETMFKRCCKCAEEAIGE